MERNFEIENKNFIKRDRCYETGMLRELHPEENFLFRIMLVLGLSLDDTKVKLLRRMFHQQ